jgi:ribosomal protein S19
MDPMQFQNILIGSAIVGFALMEFATRRYQGHGQGHCK